MQTAYTLTETTTRELDVPIYSTLLQITKQKYELDYLQSLSFLILAHDVLNGSHSFQRINLLVLDQFPHEESIFCSLACVTLAFPIINNSLRPYMLYSSQHHSAHNNVLIRRSPCRHIACLHSLCISLSLRNTILISHASSCLWFLPL